MTDGLTIQEAAATTGWSPRMLRYLEEVGLISPTRSDGGYRLFGPAQLQRLRTLRALVDRFDCHLSQVAFAQRLRSDARLRAALDAWFDTPARRPEGVAAGDWLRFEQRETRAAVDARVRRTYPLFQPTEVIETR